MAILVITRGYVIWNPEWLLDLYDRSSAAPEIHMRFSVDFQPRIAGNHFTFFRVPSSSSKHGNRKSMEIPNAGKSIYDSNDVHKDSALLA